MPYDVPPHRFRELVDVIGHAFRSAPDPLTEFVFGHEPAALTFQERIVRSLGEGCPTAALRQASSENMEAISVWFPPGVTYPEPEEDEGQLFDPAEFRSQDTRRRVEDMLESVGKSMGKLGTEPQWYLHVLATRPEYMGQGYSSPLMRPILRRANDEGKPCTLICPTHHVNLYEHFGFKIVDETQFSTSRYFLYNMRRDADL